jgi:hypothetical protein
VNKDDEDVEAIREQMTTKSGYPIGGLWHTIFSLIFETPRPGWCRLDLIVDTMEQDDLRSSLTVSNNGSASRDACDRSSRGINGSTFDETLLFLPGLAGVDSLD